MVEFFKVCSHYKINSCLRFPDKLCGYYLFQNESENQPNFSKNPDVKKPTKVGSFCKPVQRSNRCHGLFQGQNPSRQFMRFSIVDLRIGGHGHSAPHARAAFENFGGQFVNGGFVARVFAGDFFVSGAYEFFVNRVAGHAVFGGGQGLVGVGGGGQR
jgi:hypothetical protein